MSHIAASRVSSSPSVHECNSSERRVQFDVLPSLEYEEEAFNGILALERKRSERSKRPFMLMLLSVDGATAGENGDNRRRKIISCLASCKRDTDVLGWYRSGSIIGIIFTEIFDSCNGPEFRAIVERIRSSLSSNLEPDELNKVEVSTHHYPEKPGSGGSSTRLTFYPDITQHRNSRRKALFLKRVMDIVGSLVALVLSAPLLVVISVLIKLTSKGPVLFRQDRVGQYGKIFTFLKFRTMYVDNDPSIHMDYVKSFIKAPDNGAGNGGPHTGEVYKIQNDPRVTRIGKFLRKTSIDELPQFINVLTGHMSLVGPRPPIPYELENYDLWHMRRVLDMKPGITGMWQVEGRSKTTFNDMVRLDIYYTANWSIWLDLKLLFKTPMAVFAGRGGY